MKKIFSGLKMNHRDKILAALNQEIPDELPYMEILVDEELGKRLLGKKEPIDEKEPFVADGFRVS